MFQSVSSHQSFPELEKKILAFWKQHNSFRKSIEIREGEKEFVFYDGPPFATGLPHYGHILAGTIKDVIPRYKTMRGYKVNRRFGWDCHGLPVENLIEKELKLPNKKALQAFGEDNFNEACRDSVLRYTSEWEETVTRMGRWVDFKNDYKTMDPDYMESIWWVFKKLWEKGLVYQGLKPMHICPRCVTPLSNFEVNQGYKDLTDVSVTLKFEMKNSQSFIKDLNIKEGQKIFFLAWTTTPWTLGGNMFLAVHPDINYAFVSLEDLSIVVLAESLISSFEKELKSYKVLTIKKGKELLGIEYKTLFSCYDTPSKVVLADFVTTDSGTGIVHIAPAFGEDDLQIGKKEEVEAVQHVGMNGSFETKLLECIQKDFPDFKDMPVKSAKDNRIFDEQIIKYFTQRNIVFKKENLRHSYPACWRCETPLLNYATKSWFVSVEKIKDDLLTNNQQINWTPSHLKDGRFGKWLENARDWAVSRTRYWGTPLPIWECEETGEHLCIGSIKELKEFTNEMNIEDIHKHKIDHLEIKKDGKTFKRISEVFDCWFESGSMPYAQNHYPFSQKIELKNEFYVSRHGEAEHNIKNILSCTEKSAMKYPLTQKGEKEVAEEAQLLQKNFDIIVASPLLRTQQTAEIFQKHCGGELFFDDRLLEHHVGELDDTGHENWRNWRKNHDPCKESPKGGESWEQITKRVSEILHEYNEKHSGKNILFVSHGCPSELIRNYAKGIKSRSDATGLEVPKGKPLKIENLHIPANFIAEGLDQTRGWFYTLHVLSTALFNKPAFSNVIVNGIILAEDGQKMSKSKQNYPDPTKVFEEFGADAVRFYLMNSPVTNADDLRFSEHGVSDVVKNVLLPLWNAYSFFITYANADNITPNKDYLTTSNALDLYILSELELLNQSVTDSLDAYELHKACSVFQKFFDNLTNWYIRRSRRRFWAKKNEESTQDKNAAYSTLYHVLLKTVTLLAPICPFITEAVYANLITASENGSDKKNVSIHHELWPELHENFINTNLSEKIQLSQKIISLGLSLRKQEQIKVRQPLASASIAFSQKIDMSDQINTIKEELNIKNLTILDNPEELASIIVKPNAKLLGPRFGAKVQNIIKEAKSGNFKKVSDTEYLVCDEIITSQELEISYIGKEGKGVASGSGIVVSLDFEITEPLKIEGQARDLVRAIQDMRKDASYDVSDRIYLDIQGADKVLQEFSDYIFTETLSEMASIEIADQEKEEEGVIIKIQKK